MVRSGHGVKTAPSTEYCSLALPGKSCRADWGRHFDIFRVQFRSAPAEIGVAIFTANSEKLKCSSCMGVYQQMGRLGWPSFKSGAIKNNLNLRTFLRTLDRRCEPLRSSCWSIRRDQALKERLTKPELLSLNELGMKITPVTFEITIMHLLNAPAHLSAPN